MPEFTYQIETGQQRAANTPLEEGDYLCRVTAAEPAVSKAGNPMFVLELTIDGAAYPLRDWLVFTETGNRKISEAVRSCGLDKKLNLAEGQVELDAAHFHGCTGKVHLKVDEWEGKKRNKVTWWVTDWKTPQEAEDDVPF